MPDGTDEEFPQSTQPAPEKVEVKTGSTRVRLELKWSVTADGSVVVNEANVLPEKEGADEKLPGA